MTPREGGHGRLQRHLYNISTLHPSTHLTKRHHSRIQKHPFFVIELQQIRELRRGGGFRVERHPRHRQQLPRVAPLHTQRALQPRVDLNRRHVVEGLQQEDEPVLETHRQDELALRRVGHPGVVVVAFLHLELLAGPCHGGDAHLGAELDLRDHGAVHVHDDDLAGGGAEVDLLVVGGPDAASDGGFEVKHGGPVSLAGDGADEDEAVLVADEGHAAVVRPGEVGDGGVAVVYELDGPAAFVFDPDEDYARAVAGGEFLVGFVPFYEDDLMDEKDRFLAIKGSNLARRYLESSYVHDHS